jgi:hypothetical protein
MRQSDFIESMGYLLKEEALQTVEHHIQQNTLVLENLEPFPGYHGENLPLDMKPDSIFLITDRQYSAESIFRLSAQMCSYANIHFDACPAEIFVQNIQLYGIRIKGLNNYSLISDIQRCYLDHEIGFMKKRKINDPGLIRINKVFCFERLAPDIFKDLEDEHTFYVSIPSHLNWSLFRKVTENVKNNIANSNFDCASGFVYLKTILELVRIYTHSTDVNRLQIIRSKYLEEIEKIRET